MPGKMENSGRAAADEEEFNQGIILPPLIIQLKKILDQYPDDTQILKELIQNAEDAGAKEVRFLYDRNTYGQDSRYLHHPDLASYQGPALYAYNDGMFSEEDWKGIRMLSQSVKQKDPFKIGYFGMGFKSVFHLTDLPCMLSGDKLGIIDPHQHVFSASSHCWNISKRSDLLNTLPHQMEPYLGVFGCDANSFRSGFYKGTLFRFPLRQKPSPLSNVLYSSDKIQYLLQNFEHDAHLLLIFVKNLERIAIFDREKHSKLNRPLYKAEISEECIDEVRRKRAEFYNQVRSGDWQEKPIVATYQMVIQTETWTDKVSVKRAYRFLVTNYYCGGNVSPVFKNLFKDPEVGFLPWVGTAMRLDIKDGSDGTDVYRLNEDDGRIFTFLPLPSEQHSSTGLPVHVHGFFALEQNRKYIKWPGLHRYLDIHMDKGLLWNQCMLREALPKCYVSMVLEAIRLHSSTGRLTVQSIYRAFPDLSKIERKWEPILSLVYVEILKYPVVFHSSPGIQEWIEPKNAIFNSLDPVEESTSVIVEVLSDSSVKIVNIPDHFLQAIRKYCHFSLGQITAAIVAGAFKDVQYSSSLHWEHKMKLLRYFLKQTKYELLDGLQLLPLANGGFDLFHFNPKKADRTIYIAPSEEMQSLLPGLKDDFLESEIDDDIKTMLTKAAMRGYTQLKVLDAGLVGKLLPRCLPQQWLNKPRVEWNPHEYGHPPENWLESLWLFLVRSSPRELSSVDGLPILPVRTIQKVPPNKKEPETVTELISLSLSNVSLVRTMDGVMLSKDVEEIVQAIGIPVVSELPDYVKSHPIITKLYVFAPTYMGVLKAIERRCAAEGRDTIIRRMNDMTTPQQKRSLRALFSKISLYEIQRDCLDLLSQLPIFETMSGSGGSESHFISVTKTNVAAPPEKTPFPVSRLLIDTSTSDSQVLGKLLGVKQLNMAQLLSQIVFPDVEQAFYDNAEVQRIMLYVLKHYHFFLDIDKGFRKTLKSLAFLPKGDMLLTPDRFYDPDNELLQKLFLFEENFPGTSYSDPAIINVLRDVGLRGVEDVEPEDLQESAFAIQHMLSGNKNGVPVEKLVEKSNALLEYLHRHKSRLKANCSGSTLASALMSICWVRGLTTKPANYPQQLAWYQQSVGHVFYKPSEMAVKQAINLVGSVMPIVAADVYMEVTQAFGWDQPPPLDRVVSHLANVIAAYNSRDKVAFMEMARSIFAELVKHEIPMVAQLLSTRVPPEWLWHGDGFTRPENVVTIEPFMDLRPFVYGLPVEIQPFADFLENFGVKHSCDLMKVLNMFKVKYQEVDIVQANASSSSFTRSVSKTVKQSPSFSEAEVKRDLHIYVGLLNELKSRLSEAGIEEIRDELYIPVHSEIMNTIRFAPLSACTYTDDEALRQGYSTSDLSTLLDEKITLVHANVPNGTSEALGVPTLMSKMLEAEELDYSFGQTDSLTNRLNTLLEEYADGFAIPKELIQNADDAGATVVKFLYDERKNQDAMTCLIDEGMRECQGPALWIYNNAVFSDEDFENITKLNGATKENQTDKIGRFGLGFNAVYNVTDVPSFVSRHNIVILDPHTTHLGKSIRNKLKPGLKLDMRRHRRKLQSLGNQFKPFNELFGCDIRKQESYPATLFRLPLRTKAQAIRSEICQKHYDDAEVKELLRMLVRGAENLLLFTQNVINVGVYHLPRNSSPSDITELFSAEKRPIKIVRELGPPALELSKPVKGLNEEMQKFIRQCQFLRAASEVMKQVRRGASLDRIKFPDSSMLLCTDSELTAKGESLLGISKQRRVQPWFVYSCMGRGESLKMAQQEDSLVPTSGVAVQVQYIPESKAYKIIPLLDPIDETVPYGAVFSYLPLPVRSGLPVHINGSFCVAANRRYLCEQNEDDKYDPRAIWNAALMRDAVCSAYLRMLNDLASLSSPQDFEFSLLWPHPDSVTAVCSTLMKSFYQALNDTSSQSLNLFSDGLRWGTIPQTVFLDCGYERTDLVIASLSVSRQFLAAGTNRIVVSLPGWVRRALEMSEAARLLDSRTYDELQFFSKVLLPKVDIVNHADRDLLMLNALSRNSQGLNKLIKEYHCIPVTPDGTQLSTPTELVDPNSAIAKLFVPLDARFPFGETTYASPSVLQVLRNLGMKQKARDLSWEEILDRAQLMRNTSDPSVAEQLSRLLLEVMNEKLTENATAGGLRQFQQKLLELPFIPAMKKPRHFPLHWKGSDDRKNFLLKPSELYPPESKDLVGCVLYIAEDSVFPKDSGDLLNFLRLGMEWKEPSVGQVLAQLDVISNPDTENYLHDQEVSNTIQKMCNSIMTFLQEKCTNDSQKQMLRDALGNRYFILAHNRFLSPKQVAFNFTYSCAPYLYELPDFLKRHFNDLLSVVGVKESFDVRDYVFALQSLHGIFVEEALDKESLKVALQLVNLLNERMAEVGQTTQDVVSKFGPIYMPDARNVLASATDLCFNEPDCQWVPKTASDYAAFSHPLIPYTISKQLGVNTRRQEVLSKHSRGIPFGQKEPLTNRIKRILSGYPCDKEILKEFLQNADDAGATEVCFIIDPRHHGTDRVFDQSWRPLQGPALCVYNNKPFTEADLRGIQSLGQGSKGADPNKTGQYGVGFNCVYHLTDAPSFLTRGEEIGETLCIFDPHAKYVPGATVQEPGRRYDDVSQLRKIFTDIFPCYLEDKFKLDNGTMFRFPLRNEQMAKESELSDQAMTVETLRALFDKFKQEIFDCLLFLNSVNSITLTQLDARTNKLAGSYTVQVGMSEGDRLARTEFSQYLKSLAEKMQVEKLKVADVQTKELTYTVDISDNCGYSEKWMLAQRVGVDSNVKLQPSVNDAIRSGELALLPRGGVAAFLSAEDSVSIRRPSRAFCFLPLPVKTDLPVHINGHFCLDHEARRSLWQDDDAGTKTEWNNMLLRHVIAPAYISILRRAPSQLSSSMLSGNVSVMDSLGDEIPDLETYCSFFPHLTRQTSPGYWKNLMEAIYQRIDAYQEIILPVVRSSFDQLSLSISNSSMTNQTEVEWHSTGTDRTSKPYFDNLKETYRENEEHRHGTPVSPSTRRRRSRSNLKRPSHEILRQVLLQSGFRLVRLPMVIFDSFVAAGVDVGCVSPKAVIDFYASYKSKSTTCLLPSLPADISTSPFWDESTLKVVLDYCSQDIPYFRSNLNGLPLLLSEDGQLRQFSNREKVYLSRHSELLPGLGSLFIHRTLVGTVFMDADTESCDVFRRFDVKAFASILSNVLSSNYQSTSGPGRVKWNIDDTDAVPNERWIISVWTFLFEEFERMAEQQPNASENHLAKTLLQPIRDWSLLPALTYKPSRTSTRLSVSSPRTWSTSEEPIGDRYLVAIRIADTVLDYSQASIMSSSLRHCLGRLGVLELDCGLLDGNVSKRIPGKLVTQPCGSQLARLIVSTPEQPKAMLTALDHIIGKSSQGRSSSLTTEECYTILKYFSDAADGWEEDKDMKKALRDLPLHLTIHDSVESLGNNSVFLLEDDLPKTEMDAIQQKAAVVFLRANQALSRFYSILDCSPIEATEVYLDYVFNHFDHLSPNGRLVHLQFLKDYKLTQLRGDQRNVFVTGLSKLRFLPGSDARLHQATEFLDPSNPVFKVMYKDDPKAFPPQPFSDYGWLDFLRNVGLQKDLTVELLIKFAKQIAEAGRTDPTDETYNQSRTLITHLFKIKNLPTVEILEELVDIPFVPSCKIGSMSQKIFNAFGVTTSYITFKEGIPANYEVLVWSSCFLLPDWANPYQLTEHDVNYDYPADSPFYSLEAYRREIGRLLKVEESPAVDLVVEHMQNICSLPISKSDDTLELRNYMKMDVMNKIYKFLQQKLLDSGSRDDIQKILHRLADTPCIVSDLGQAFVKPRQVVINLYEEDQIYPYLHQAPTELGEFKKLFLYLGATLHATAEQYASVLENIYYEAGREKLHPNEMRLAFKAVCGLFTTLQRHRHKDGLVHVHNLFLPTKLGHLCRSTDIIFNDEPAYTDRIENLRRPFLVDLAECKLMAANYEEVVKLLPHRLRPAMLSAVVQERMEDKSRDSVMLHTTADKLKYQINSRPFAQGLIRLIKNEHRRSGHRVRQTILDSIEQNLKKIHVYGVDRVITYLEHDNERIPGSELDCECYIDKKLDEDTGAEVWSIYINKTTCLNEELQVAVSEGINRMSCGLLKNSIHYIQPILSCLPHSIPKVLDRLKVRPDNQYGSDSAQPTLPNPGTFIPTEDHHLLKEDFEEFETGEYVGFELDDDESEMPTVIYAVIIEKIVDENFDQTRKMSESDQFAHRKLTQRYRINVGDERPPGIALATDLYKFHRIEGFAPRVSVSEPYSPGAGPKKTSRGGYRESFYSRSSVFEPEDGLPSARPSMGKRESSRFAASRGSSQNAFSEDNLFADSSQKNRKSFRDEPEENDFVTTRKSATRRPDDFTGRPEFGAEEDSGYNAGSFQSTQDFRAGSNQQQFYADEQTEQHGQTDEAFDQANAEETITTEKVMEEVSDTLEEAWKLPEGQRKKIIKRLLLKWHPDKNIGNEAFSTVITQHIQAELERLELGLPRPSHFDPSQFDFDPRNPFAGSSSFQQNFANAYKFFFDQMNQRAKEHKQQRERYQENYSRDYKGDYNFGVPPTFSSANPQPAQAKRFLRQAQEDLRAADNDYEAHDPAYEWVCFKAHQASEKALKAAQFAVDAVTSFSHDLVTLAASLEDVELRRLAQKLQKIVGNSNKLYNPDPIDFVVIPHEEYTKEMACDAVMCSVDILERVKEFVELRDYS